VANEKGEVSEENFVKVGAFYDLDEQKPEQLKEKDEEFDDEDEDQFVDQERLLRVKQLLFRVNQENTGMIKAAPFCEMLAQLVQGSLEAQFLNLIF